MSPLPPQTTDSSEKLAMELRPACVQTPADVAAADEMVQIPQGYFERHTSRPYVSGMHEYRELYEMSIRDPNAFWAQQARQLLHFDTDFHTVHSGSFANGDNSWFLGGRLNGSFNCVDRHAFKNPDKVALIFEADEPGKTETITYGELLRQVSRLAWLLKSRGVRKGDTVAIYLPAIPAGFIALLACIRIGAIHSVVFAGFSPTSLRDRILDAHAKVVITADEGRRGGKIINTKRITDDAVLQCPDVSSVIVYKHTGTSVPWTPGRDVWWQDEAKQYPAYLAPEPLDSEDPMFLLYTSGSTGKPKGLMHTTAGYLLGAAITGKYVLDLHEQDTYFCTGDLGWITGHTYSLYAPLLLGATVIVYEGTPGHPTFSRYWDIIDDHKVTHFYTAPTTLRLLRRAGNDFIKREMAHLRLIACVGEPIAAEVWNWIYDAVGKKAQILDTFFQTESGAHLLSPFAGVTPMKPGSVTLPFFGIVPVILDPQSGRELEGNNVEGVLAIKHPWPSMARSVWRAHQRFMDTYFNVYESYYFTGDGAGRDKDGYYWIRGRVDDVINVAAHRLSTAEIEAALLENPKISEAAVVGVSDEVTGQAVNAFVSLRPNMTGDEKEFISHVRALIGSFAAPKVVFIVEDLPKTRSGKIMRRILRKIVDGEESSIGDTSTLFIPGVVEDLIATVHARLAPPSKVAETSNGMVKDNARVKVEEMGMKNGAIGSHQTLVASA